jgi:hypothetical protein
MRPRALSPASVDLSRAASLALPAAAATRSAAEAGTREFLHAAFRATVSWACMTEPTSLSEYSAIAIGPS